MTWRCVRTSAVLLCTLSAAVAIAQPGDRCMSTEARVLDLVFPLDVGPKPYFTRLAMRYGDSDTQIVVAVFPGGSAEMVRYSLAGMGRSEFSQLVSRMVAKNPDVKDQEIAAKVKVQVTRSPVEFKALDHALGELKAMRISPFLATRVASDESTEYEYWFDTWQESVHYVITGPFDGSTQDQLVQWLIRHRANLEELAKVSTTPGGSKLK